MRRIPVAIAIAITPRQSPTTGHAWSHSAADPTRTTSEPPVRSAIGQDKVDGYGTHSDSQARYP